MDKPNIFEYKVYGRYALFTDPITKVGGEKFTYQIPTYQALKGITESIYWKPTIQYYIDEVRIVNTIRTQSQGIRPIHYNDSKNDLSIYTYLKDVEYDVRGHFDWNENRKDLINDRNENKHYEILQRMIAKGGRRDIFLGSRECQGYVEPCKFDEGHSDYEGKGTITFGIMLHGITYPDEVTDKSKKGTMSVRLWAPKMENGIIRFPKPEECTIVKDIGKRDMKEFISGVNFTEGGDIR